MDIKRFVGGKIRRARKEKKISQRELGVEVGYAAPTISQLENGEFRVSIESLKKVADVLNKPLSYFLPREEERDYTLPSKLTTVEKELLEIRRVIEKDIKRAKENFFHIVVTGNICSGKALLVKKLAKHYSGNYFLIKDLDNPFLIRYYKDKKKWAFKSQLYFIAESFRIHSEVNKSLVPAFQDRSIYEQFEVFVESLYEQEVLNSDEFEILQKLYSSAKSFLNYPDLIIYLRLSPEKAVERIREEGEVFERGLDENYIERLNNKHDVWIREQDIAPFLTIPVEEIDPSQKRGFAQIVSKIERSL